MGCMYGTSADRLCAWSQSIHLWPDQWVRGPLGPSLEMPGPARRYVSMLLSLLVTVPQVTRL